ncbi:hypothetical protein NQZ68_018371 [Dissostichus eleginoides]|nr:hypothetical protein NQZ68_018371 [Dissostichus eleginoides]
MITAAGSRFTPSRCCVSVEVLDTTCLNGTIEFKTVKQTEPAGRGPTLSAGPLSAANPGPGDPHKSWRDVNLNIPLRDTVTACVSSSQSQFVRSVRFRACKSDRLSSTHQGSKETSASPFALS